MQNSMLNRVRIAAMLLLILGGAGRASAQYAGGIPWHVGDVAVCFGDGTCNMLRITGTDAVTLLDQFSDGLTGKAATYGAAINNSLHLLVTDAGTGLYSGSNIVEYSIASINPSTGGTVAHTPVTTFNGEGSNILAVALNNAGDMYVLNNDSSSPTIVELSQTGGKVASTSLSGCSINGQALSSATSMDLSYNGTYAWVTSGSTIQQVTLSNGTCTEFANFGPNVTVYGIKDIPPGALASAASCKGATCPTDESLLVVATGVIDPAGVNIDICTDAQASTPVTDSCGLLIDTNPSDPGLTAPLWQKSTSYALSTKILDPSLELQRATTAGTSGTTKPPFSETGGTAIDNAVIWTNEGSPQWSRSTQYTMQPFPGTYIVDPSDNLETVVTGGISGPGPTPPAFPTNFPAAGETADGLVWQEQLGPVSGYSIHAAVYGTSATNSYVEDTSSFVWKALQAGTSGTGCCNDSTFQNTPDNSVTWQDQGQQTWHASFAFSAGAIIVDPNSHVQKVTTAGTSSASLPAFSTSGGTISDGLTWTDLGVPLGNWASGTPYSQGQIVTDNNSPTHYQQVVVAGTSGGTEPTFNTTGGYTLDQSNSSVVWHDLGQTGGMWIAGTFYPQNAVILASGHVQQATSAGTSGSGSAPAFSTSGGFVNDNVVMWTDEGALGVSIPASYRWAASTAYPNNTTAEIVDTASPPHVQIASATVMGQLSGISGTPNPPVFVDGGKSPLDGSVVWTDEGQQFWQANTPFSALSIIIDGKNHVQQATTPGTSGPGQPNFVDGASPGGMVTDGLVWTDLGVPLGNWASGTPYSQGQIVTDNNSPTHYQQVVVAGTSGGTEPTFNTTGGYTLDQSNSSVVWHDLGQTGGMWIAGTFYPQNAVILASGHVQQATSAGTSGSGSAPAFSTSGGFVNDNAVVWTDQGLLTTTPLGPANFRWAAGTMYPNATTAEIVDSNIHVQKATTAGTSGGAAPAFVDGGTVFDGLIWTFVTGPVLPYPAVSTLFAVGNQIIDQNNYLQKAIQAGTSLPITNPLTWNDALSGKTIDNAVIWTESHPTWAPGTYTVGNANTLILDNNNNVELVTNNNLANKVNSTSGTSGPSQPSWNTATGANPITGVTGTTVDGLTWTNQVSNPDSSVIARYPVAGVTTLESGALDPLVSNCQNNVCTTTVSPSPYPVPTIDNVYLYTNFSLPAAGFWLGDSASPTFYRLDFATGSYTNSTYDASQSCSGCTSVSGIESLVPYGSEGSNQPDLAELFTGNLTTPTSSTPNSNSETVQFLGNTMTASVYVTSSGSSTIGSIPLAIYGSPVNPLSDFTDSPAIPNGVPCTPTYTSTGTSPNTCLVWKTDLFSLTPNPADYLSLKVAGPSSITNNTDLYTDSGYDVTVLNGNFDPAGGNKGGSAQGLFQVSTTNSEAQSGCLYLSPLLECYTDTSLLLPYLPFAFQCPKAYPGSNLDKLEPTLGIAQLYPNVYPIGAPDYPAMTGINSTTNYAYNSILETFLFNWIPPRVTTTQYYQACTNDRLQNPALVAPFCQSFILSPNCLANPWIYSISPSSDPEGTTITITGAFFASGATVTFENATGTAKATSVTVHSPLTITTTVPSNTPLGPVNVTVTNSNGLNYTLVNGYNNTSP